MGALSGHIDAYAELRELAPSSVGFYRRCIRQFEAAVGPVDASELTDALVNAWLVDMRSRGLSASYRAGLKTAVVTLWKHAAEELGLPGPGKIVRVRRTRAIPRCWSVSQVSSLRAQAAALPGLFLGSLPRG